MTTAFEPRTLDTKVPPFEPHPWLRNCHAQTIAGLYLPGPRIRLDATEHEIEADGGDRLVALESVPRSWPAGGPAAVLVHGLAGCARSPYVVRLAARLVRLGVRTVRMNLRAQGRGSAAPATPTTPAGPRTCAGSSNGSPAASPVRPSRWSGSHSEATLS